MRGAQKSRKRGGKIIWLLSDSEEVVSIRYRLPQNPQKIFSKIVRKTASSQGVALFCTAIRYSVDCIRFFLKSLAIFFYVVLWLVFTNLMN